MIRRGNDVHFEEEGSARSEVSKLKYPIVIQQTIKLPKSTVPVIRRAYQKADLSFFSASSLSTISRYFSVPAFRRYVRSPTLKIALVCPCSGSNCPTNVSQGNSLHSPQCVTLCFLAHGYTRHSPQKRCPSQVLHPGQCGVLCFV